MKIFSLSILVAFTTLNSFAFASAVPDCFRESEDAQFVIVLERGMSDADKEVVFAALEELNLSVTSAFRSNLLVESAVGFVPTRAQELATLAGLENLLGGYGVEAIGCNRLVTGGPARPRF